VGGRALVTQDGTGPGAFRDTSVVIGVTGSVDALRDGAQLLQGGAAGEDAGGRDLRRRRAGGAGRAASSRWGLRLAVRSAPGPRVRVRQGRAGPRRLPDACVAGVGVLHRAALPGARPVPVGPRLPGPPGPSRVVHVADPPGRGGGAVGGGGVAGAGDPGVAGEGEPTAGACVSAVRGDDAPLVPPGTLALRPGRDAGVPAAGHAGRPFGSVSSRSRPGRGTGRGGGRRGRASGRRSRRGRGGRGTGRSGRGWPPGRRGGRRPAG
jgi:hypothetical protein